MRPNANGKQKNNYIFLFRRVFALFFFFLLQANSMLLSWRRIHQFFVSFSNFDSMCDNIQSEFRLSDALCVCVFRTKATFECVRGVNVNDRVCMQIDCRMDFFFSAVVKRASMRMWQRKQNQFEIYRGICLYWKYICCESLSPGAMNCHLSIAFFFLSFRWANKLNGIIRITREGQCSLTDKRVE